jgi:hypothetical protein
MIQVAERIPDLWTGWIAWKAAGYAQMGEIAKAKAEAKRFVAAIRQVWRGDPDAGIDDYVAWLLGFCPFRRAEDRAHLLEGLERAGLSGNGDLTAYKHASEPIPASARRRKA